MAKRTFFQPGEYASIPKELLSQPTKAIPLAAKVVYLGLQSYLSAGKTTAWPGLSSLSRNTGLSRRAIQKGIDKLVAAGWIDRDSRGGPNGTNLYTLHPQRMECASAQNAPPLAQEMPKDSARNAPKELKERTPRKNTNRGRRKAQPDPRVKELIEWFSQKYQLALGRPYVVTAGKDGQLVKRLLRSLSPDEFQQATRNMLADSWGGVRASIGLLSSQINIWRGKGNLAKERRQHDYVNGF